MSLIPNKKNKKDTRPGTQKPAKSNFLVHKGKANTRGSARNTKLTGGSQRGS